MLPCNFHTVSPQKLLSSYLIHKASVRNKLEFRFYGERRSVSPAKNHSLIRNTHDKALTIREFVHEIFNVNLKNCLNFVRNKPIIVKSQISILLSHITQESLSSLKSLIHFLSFLLICRPSKA